MARSRSGRRPGLGLRARLLVPPLLLIPLLMGGYTLFQERLIAREEAVIVERRTLAVLDGTLREVEQRKRAKEVFARLMADEPGLAAAARAEDRVELARILVPLQSALGLGFIEVADQAGHSLVELGTDPHLVSPEPAERTRERIAGALSGITGSWTAVSPSGITVAAASPIKDSGGIVGVLELGATIDGDDLAGSLGRGDVAIATVSGGALSTLSRDDPDLARALRSYAVDGADLNASLAALDYRASITDLGGDGQLISIVSIADLRAGSQQRIQTYAIASIAFVLCAMFGIAMVARSVTRPIERVAAVAKAITGGDYTARAETGGVAETAVLASAINHLAAEVEQQVAQLTRQALHDPVADLPNRAGFLARMTSIADRSSDRVARHDVALLFLDLDDFKAVNDSFGHQCGDALLYLVARRLEGAVRAPDLVARFGGDEFIVLLEDTERKTAVATAERIQAALRAPFAVDGRDLTVSASVGIVVASVDRIDIPDLLRNADVAMYQASETDPPRPSSSSRPCTWRSPVDTNWRRTSGGPSAPTSSPSRISRSWTSRPGE